MTYDEQVKRHEERMKKEREKRHQFLKNCRSIPNGISLALAIEERDFETLQVKLGEMSLAVRGEGVPEHLRAAVKKMAEKDIDKILPRFLVLQESRTRPPMQGTVFQLTHFNTPEEPE